MSFERCALTRAHLSHIEYELNSEYCLEYDAIELLNIKKMCDSISKQATVIMKRRGYL
jgi:hypothetical protein